MNTAKPDLTVVIPAYNAGKTIGPVIDSFLTTGPLGVEVIVVDDGSADDTVAVVKAYDQDEVVLLTQANRGAGVARNTGFERARGRYTLFFDADDEIDTKVLAAVVSGLDDTGADLAMTPYRYRRGHSSQFDGMNTFDNLAWAAYVTRPKFVTTLSEVPRLLGFSNYPWNKILRTEHYRDNGLRFGATPVHNDVLGHWMSLLDARRIMLVDSVLCTHIVNEGAANLTNRNSRQRLSLFDALEETYQVLADRPELRNRYSHHYWDFALRVAAWAGGRIDEDLRDEFNLRLQHHLLEMNLVDYTRIRRRRNPSLADLILRRVLS